MVRSLGKWDVLSSKALASIYKAFSFVSNITRKKRERERRKEKNSGRGQKKPLEGATDLTWRPG